jgi:hypothetical protein
MTDVPHNVSWMTAGPPAPLAPGAEPAPESGASAPYVGAFTNLLPRTVRRPAPERGEPIEEQFWRYHKAHPEVYRAFVETARLLKERGERRLSARAIFEYLRYRSLLDMRSGAEAQAYKVRNAFSPYYARLLLVQYPEFAGRFIIAELRSNVLPATQD